jgi:hypothetical protein
VTARWSAHADEVAPYREVALAAEKAWRETTPEPLRYVGGVDALEQAAAFYAADRPHAFINFDFDYSAWVDRRALADSGLLSICPIVSASCLKRADLFGGRQARRLEVEFSHEAWGHASIPFRYQITITPPTK